MATYMSVERTAIQTAFAKAHKAACDETLTPAIRKRFKGIAAEIWRACGEGKTMPSRLPAGFPGSVKEPIICMECGQPQSAHLPSCSDANAPEVR